MALILSSGRALSFFGGVGYDLLSGTIIKTCQSIGRTVYYLSQSPDYLGEINSELHRLDLEAKMTIIHSYIKTSEEDNSNNKDSEYDSFCRDNLVERLEHIEAITDQTVKTMIAGGKLDSRQVALIYLYQSLQRIDGVLNCLQDKVQKYRAKWFRSWRSIDSTSSLKELREENDILDKRLKLLGHLSLIQ